MYPASSPLIRAFVDVADLSKGIEGQRHELDQLIDLVVVDAQSEGVTFADTMTQLRGEALRLFRPERRVTTESESIGRIRRPESRAAGQDQLRRVVKA